MSQLIDAWRDLQISSDKAESDTKASPSPANVDPLFADSDADVTFCSSDGVHYQMQRKFLEANTGAFPGSEFDTRGEVVYLTEPSHVLRVLFGFVHPRRHPDIEELEFKALADVAEAAEKYEVFSAIDICKMQMRQFVGKHPVEILIHAARHGHSKLIQNAAPHLARLSTITVVEQLPPRFVVPWLNYRKAWDALFDDTTKLILDAGVARPSGRPPYAYFASSLQPEACYACKIAMLTSIQEFKDITAVNELKEALSKPRPRLMQCLTPSCQYNTVFSKLCEDMKAKMEGLSAFILPPSRA